MNSYLQAENCQLINGGFNLISSLDIPGCTVITDKRGSGLKKL
jgi:hypothetical protein